MSAMPHDTKPAYALIGEFRAAMQAAGIEPPDIIEPGTLHRFPGAGKTGKNIAAWCRLFDDMKGGVFGDFSSGLQSTWQSDSGATWSHEERVAFAKKCAAEKKARAEQEAKRREKAALKAVGILAAAAGDPAAHPYAVLKGSVEGVSLGGLVKRGAWPQRGWDDALLIPIYSASGKIWTLGAINADGQKDYLAGGAKQGNFHPSGKIRGAARVFVGEGIATVAVAYLLDGSPAVAAMDAGNLEAVAKIVRCLAAPGADIVFLADDDAHEDAASPNTGIVAATKAAQAVGGRVALPGMGRKADFWDVWRERGLDAVRAAIDGADAQARQAGPEPEQDGDMPEGYEDYGPDGFEEEPLNFSAGRGDSPGGLLLDRFGQPISCSMNAKSWLLQSGHHFEKNMFTQEFSIDRKPASDGAAIALLIEIQEKFRVNLRKEHCMDAMLNLCEKNPFHPVKEYLESCLWDGQDRLDEMLNFVFGHQRQPFSDIMGRYWMVSGVARIFDPGKKADYSLLLIGHEEGTGKSSFGDALVPEPKWFTDDVGGDLHSREAETGLFGKWIVEFAEGMRGDRAGKDTFKGFLTRKTGRVTLKYERFAADFDRQCIFYTTTNNPTPLDGFDEDRRQWPVSVRVAVDNAWVRENRDQLWGEAVVRFKRGEQYWIDRDLIAQIKAQVHEKFEHYDALIDLVAQYVSVTPEPIFVGHLMEWLKIGGDKSKSVQMRVAACLRKIGYAKGEQIKAGPDRDKIPWHRQNGNTC